MPVTIYLPPGGGHHVIFDSIESYSSYFMRREKEVRQLDLISGDITHCRIFYPADGSFTPFEVFRLLRKLVPEYGIPTDRYIVTNVFEDIGVRKAEKSEEGNGEQGTESNASSADLSEMGEGEGGSNAGVDGYLFLDSF